VVEIGAEVVAGPAVVIGLGDHAGELAVDVRKLS
jgi:hypothetical protein